MKSVTFKNKTWDVAANLHVPNSFDESKTFPAIVVAHPISSCKEQTSGIYAARMAELGYVCLAFDASTQGASGGLGEYLEDPAVAALTTHRLQWCRCRLVERRSVGRSHGLVVAVVRHPSSRGWRSGPEGDIPLRSSSLRN